MHRNQIRVFIRQVYVEGRLRNRRQIGNQRRVFNRQRYRWRGFRLVGQHLRP